MNRRDALKVFAGSVAATVCAGEAVASEVVMENDVLVLTVSDDSQMDRIIHVLRESFPQLEGRVMLVSDCIKVDVVKERV